MKSLSRRLLPLAGLAAAALITTSFTPAHAASGDGEAMILAILLGDIIAIPADIYMAATNTPIPRGWSQMEAVGGGLQAVAGGIGVGACAADIKCRDGAAMPALIGFTAWTSIIAMHGLFTLNSSRPSYASLTPSTFKPAPFKLTPMIGDGRTTPAGIGLTGTF